MSDNTYRPIYIRWINHRCVKDFVCRTAICESVGWAVDDDDNDFIFVYQELVPTLRQRNKGEQIPKKDIIALLWWHGFKAPK